MRAATLTILWWLTSCLVLAQTLPHAARAGEKLPPIYFNHIPIYLDDTLFKAIGESQFLKTEFANLTANTVTRDGGKWSYSGEYLFGQHTAFEFLKGDPKVEKDQPPGEVDFGLWIDDREQLPSIAKNLESAFHNPCEVNVQKRFVSGHDILWYDSVEPPLPPRLNDTTNLWVMATYSTYLKQTYPDLKPSEDGTTREKYNARRYKPDLLLKDIVGVRLGVEPEQVSSLAEQFKALGYHVEIKGEITTAEGPDVTFEFVSLPASAPRTAEVRFSLNRPKTGQQTYEFGDGSELRFHSDQTGTWTFPGAIKYDLECTTDQGRKSLPPNALKYCPH